MLHLGKWTSTIHKENYLSYLPNHSHAFLGWTWSSIFYEVKGSRNVSISYSIFDYGPNYKANNTSKLVIGRVFCFSDILPKWTNMHMVRAANNDWWPVIFKISIYVMFLHWEIYKKHWSLQNIFLKYLLYLIKEVCGQTAAFYYFQIWSTFSLHNPQTKPPKKSYILLSRDLSNQFWCPVDSTKN